MSQNPLSRFFKNQAELAGVITGGLITNAARIRASRIWNGQRKPDDAEMPLIYSFTNGGIDANYFAGLTKPKKPKTKKS